MPVPLVYNLRNLRVRKISSLLTASGIALVTLVFTGMFAMGDGIERSLLGSGDPNNLLCLRAQSTAETQSLVTKTQVDDILALEGIARDGEGKPLVSGELVVVANMTKKDGRRSNVAIRGVGEQARALRGNLQVVEGRWFRPGLAELVVGEGIGGQIQGLKVGDRPKIRGLEWTVVGRFSAGGQAFESEIWGDIEDLKKQFKRDYSAVLLRPEKPSDLDRLARVIKEDKRLALDAKPQPEYYVDQNQAAQMIKAMGVVLAFVLSIGALFGAANTMYAAVAVRTREVATMRVLGFTRGAIWLSFVFESALLGLAGGLAGAGVSYLAFNGITTGTVNWVSFSEMAFKFRVTPSLMGWAVGLAVLMGVGGGFLPAWRASRAPIARALRGL